MPYGPSSYRSSRAKRVSTYTSRSGFARRTKVAAARTKNTSVAKTQRRPYVPRLLRNTRSITVLANQVDKLQKSQIGRVQTKVQLWQLPKSLTTTWTTKTLYSNAPIAFCLNNFTDAAKVYQRAPALSTDVTNTELYNREGWQLYNGLSGSGDSNARGFDKDSSYWKTTQDNEVSREYYLPLSSQIKFEFARGMKSGDDTEVVRIDIVQPKRNIPETMFNHLSLPEGLMGLRNLAGKTMLDRNKINPAFFKVIKTKYLYFKNSESGGNTDTRTIRKQWTWNQKFPDKILRMDLNAYQQPKIRGAPIPHVITNQDGTTTTTYTYGPDQPGAQANFQDIINPKETFWAIVSTSNLYENDLNWSMSMLRTNKWRDPHGLD